MPQSQADVILDSITLDNIDDAMYFYSHILEKIVEKKKKFQHNEEILKLKKLDIKAEIKKLKRSMDSDSESESETDSD